MARRLDLYKFYLGRLGKVGVAGMLLIIVGLIYDYSVVRPREAALDEQLLRNEQARREAAEQRARAAQTGMDASGLPAMAPAVAAALRKLFEAAEKAGVELDQGEYRLTEVKEAKLRRYQLSLPVFGSYPDIRAFVTEAINADPALALTSVQLRRDKIENPELDALLNFTLYLEAGA